MDTTGSAREAEAHARADERLRRQRQALRPFGLVVIAAVAIGAVNGRPALGLQGEGLGVLLVVVVFAAALALAVRGSFLERSMIVQAVVIGVMGAAGVALVALQPQGATELAGGAAVWMAVVRLPFTLGAAVAVALTIGLDLALAIGGGSAAAVLATTLLCALLALVRVLHQAGTREPGAQPSCCSRSSRTPARNSCGRQRSPSADGSPPSCTTCSPTRSLA